MLQLQTNTPFSADFALFPDENAIDSLYLMVKAGFTIGKHWTLMDPQPPLQEGDEYWVEPESSSLRYGTDYHLGKMATDIVMLGHAYAPHNKPVRQLDVTLSVGKVSKTVRVFGDRYWQHGQISSPTAFISMPIVYEKAYGGQWLQEGEIEAADMRNPVGCGFIGDHGSVKNNSWAEIENLPLPNIEDPGALITSPTDQPAPAGFGYIDPAWELRQRYAGNYDEQWRHNRAPFLPENFDKRFFSAAHPDLIYPDFVKGGESVSITNMHPEGNLAFELPMVKLAARVNLQRTVLTPTFQLETVQIEPNRLQLSMVWRAKVSCDKKVLKIKSMSVSLTRGR